MKTGYGMMQSIDQRFTPGIDSLTASVGRYS
jgi:hypothetical protein